MFSLFYKIGLGFLSILYDAGGFGLTFHVSTYFCVSCLVDFYHVLKLMIWSILFISDSKLKLFFTLM